MSQETIQIAKSISTEFATALKSQVSQLRDEFNSNLSLTAESVTSIRRIVDEFESKWLAVDSQIGHQKTLMEAQKSIFDVEIKSLKGLINDVLSKSVNQIVDDLKSEFGEKLRINDGLHEEFTKKLSDNERANIDRVKTVIDSFEKKWANTDGAIADHAERFAKELTNIRKSIAESFNVDTVMNRILDEHGHLLKGAKGDEGEPGKSPNPAEVAKHILRDKNFADMVKPEPVDPVVVADTLMKRHGDELKGEAGKDADPVDVVEVVGELMLKHGEAIRGKPGRDADEKLVAEKLMADQKFIGLVKEVIHSEPWTVGVYREGSVVKHFTGREYIAMQDTTEEPGDSTHWKRIGTHGLRDTGGYKADQQYEPGDFYHKDGSTFFFDGVNHRLFAAKPFTKAEFDKEFKRIQDTVTKYHELHADSQKSIGMIEDVLVQNKAVIEDQGQRIQSLEKDVVDLLLQPTEINDGSVPLRAYKGQYVEGNEYVRGDVVTSYGVAYVKQSAGNGGLGDKSTWAKMTGGVSRSGGGNATIQSVNSISGLSTGVGVSQIGNSLFVSDGKNITPINGGGYKRAEIDVDPIEIDFALAHTSKTNGGGITATTFANGTQYGTEFGWNAGTVMADGHYVAISKALTPLDLSNLDNFVFELGFSGNHTNTRIVIVFGSAGSAGTASHRATVFNGTEKPEVCALTLRKSDFALFGTGGVNWASVNYIEIRFTHNGATTNADTQRSMFVYRVGIGGYTKPKLVISCDDIATELLPIFDLVKQRNIKGTHFVTDTEILNGGLYKNGKMTKAQLDEWAAAGWDFAPHNVNHKAFGLAVGAYSKTGTVVTMEIAWGSSTNIKEEISLAVGDKITVSRCNRTGVNGNWTVSSVAALGANTRQLTFDTGSATAVDSQGTIGGTQVYDGGVLSIDKYDVGADNLTLQNIIEAEGYPVNKQIMAYTYGQHDFKAKKALFNNGVKIMRTTAGAGTGGVPSIVQIRRKHGITPSTFVDYSDNTPRFNSNLFSFPTLGLTTLNALQTEINKLLLTGGVYSVFWHGDEQGMTTQIMTDVINYLADLRDSGQIDLITFEDLIYLTK